MKLLSAGKLSQRIVTKKNLFLFVIIVLFTIVSFYNNQKLATASKRLLDSKTNNNIIVNNNKQNDANRVQQRRILIDVGANCGNSYYRIKQGMGAGTNETLKFPSPDVWETYLWECNPQLIKWFLNDLIAKENNVTLIPKAATTFDGNITFYLTAGQEHLSKDQIPNSICDPSSPYQPGGASSIYGNALRAGESIKVDSVHF
jgi:hypothetical protein